MLYILWAKVRDWATFSSGMPATLALQAQDQAWGKTFQNWDPFGKLIHRIPILFFIVGIQLLYFPINQKGYDTARLDLPIIDGGMPLIGIFVVPYMMGAALILAIALFATLFLPRKLYQEFTVAFLTAMLIGYCFWILYPSYIYKAPFTPNNVFEQWTMDLHLRDSEYGNHNSFPSSHVYYITVLMYFFAKRWPRTWFWWALVAVINAWSTMFTHQHYFVDVLTGLFLTIFAIWFARDIVVPRIRKYEAQRKLLIT